MRTLSAAGQTFETESQDSYDDLEETMKAFWGVISLEGDEAHGKFQQSRVETRADSSV